MAATRVVAEVLKFWFSEAAREQCSGGEVLDIKFVPASYPFTDGCG